MSKKSNGLKVSDVEIRLISHSNNYRVGTNDRINQYVVTFYIGKQRYSQTKHMTESEIKKYAENPSIDVVGSGFKKGLQDCHYNIKD